MSPSNHDDDPALDLLLAGAPDHIFDAVFSDSAAVDATREALAALALTLEPVAPSPGARAALAARLAATSQPTRGNSALVVLDMIEDYLTPGRPLHVPRARVIVPALRARIEQARRDGLPVIYLCDHHEPDDPELDTWPAHAVAGTSGGNVVAELAPLPTDVVLPHRTYSAFFGSQFDDVLRKLDVSTVVLTGCATDVGLFATAVDALMRGYRVEVPPDCQAGTSHTAERVALGSIRIMRPLAPLPRAEARG